MLQDYHFDLNEELLQELVTQEKWPEAFELLAEPLHEWLYEEQAFERVRSRTTVEQLILSFDYVQMQVAQGGFIQLIQNGYTPLLVMVIESLQALNLAPDMTGILDDALKVYVLNKEVLDRETSVEEFGRLYGEFKEFEVLEERFNGSVVNLLTQIVLYVNEKNFLQ